MKDNSNEFISLLYDFNESLSGNNKNIIYDKPTLKNLIESSTLIEPAKVIVVYDLYGNIINPGINLVDGTLTGSTSDVLYDSERTILDNIYLK
ncbi:MAG: hypothetical protein KFW07_02945 [Mycoplasmataceae bacterium]|nr:hypothetical protein [Mycoplasmataceae bacterium]